MSWWVDNCALGTPAVIVWRDATGAFVGGAAFEVDRYGTGPLKVERVRSLGQGLLAPDHLDVIATAGNHDAVAAATAGWLRSRDRLVDLDGLADGGALTRALGARPISRVAAPYRELDSAEPLAGLPGKVRSTVKRSAKRLGAAGFHVERVEPAQAAAALDTLLSLHDTRWEDGSDFSGAWHQFREGATTALRRGDAVIHQLIGQEDATVIASELELVAGDRLAFYQAGRLTDHEYRGSGSALKAAIVDWAATSGMHEFDFLRGDEPYKHEWATGSRDVVRVRFGTGRAGRGAAAIANGVFKVAPRVFDRLVRSVGEERAVELSRRFSRLFGS